MIVVVGLITAKNAFQKAGQRAPQVPDNTSPAAIPPSPSNPKQSAASSSPEPSPSEKAARPKAAFSIKIGDKIDDGVPGPGAGAIETPYGQDAYIFTAAPGQKSLFSYAALQYRHVFNPLAPGGWDWRRSIQHVSRLQ